MIVYIAVLGKKEKKKLVLLGCDWRVQLTDAADAYRTRLNRNQRRAVSPLPYPHRPSLCACDFYLRLIIKVRSSLVIRLSFSKLLNVLATPCLHPNSFASTTQLSRESRRRWDRRTVTVSRETSDWTPLILRTSRIWRPGTSWTRSRTGASQCGPRQEWSCRGLPRTSLPFRTFSWVLWLWWLLL